MKKKIFLLAACLLTALGALADDLSSIVTSSCEGVTMTITEGAKPWTVADGKAHIEGTGGNFTASFNIDLTCTEPVHLSFDGALAGYSPNDYLTLAEYESDSELLRLWTGQHATSKKETFTGSYAYIPTGTHHLRVVYFRSSSNKGGEGDFAEMGNLRLEKVSALTTTITMDTPGFLGTKVVKAFGDVKNAKCLKIEGAINSADWTALKGMTGLEVLDMAGTNATAIPADAFNGGPSLKLYTFPAGVTTIGNNAFRGQKLVGNIVIPEGVTSIGDYAFYNTQSILRVTLPQSLTSLGQYAFAANGSSNPGALYEVTLGSGLTSLPNYVFHYRSNLRTVRGASAVAEVGSSAFYYCKALTTIEGFRPTTVGSSAFSYCTSLPAIDLSALQSLEGNAFSNCEALTSVTIPDVVTEIPSQAFYSCENLREVVLGASVRQLGSQCFGSCPNITDFYMSSPTPPERTGTNNTVDAALQSTVVLHVPDYAMVSYKSHEYWQKFSNFAVNELPVTYLNLAGPLVLTGSHRIDGTPGMNLDFNAHLDVIDAAPQAFGDFSMMGRWRSSEYNNPSMVNYCPNVTSGSTTVNYYLGYNSSTTPWYYICLPFDVNVSEITISDDAFYAARYYDGAARAAGTTPTWKDVPADGVLHAGQGYIFASSATNKYTTLTLPATEATHNALFTASAITLPLTTYTASSAENAGWNLVGNAYPAFYDIYYMDYTAPITVWNTTDRKYTAVSPLDDDFVLQPFQAFFVQKPEGVDAITLQPEGRQHSMTIERSAASALRAQAPADRRLTNIVLSASSTDAQGKFSPSDRTRVVLNPAVGDEFDARCDAAKMMSYDGVPQLYTLADGVSYAINEGQHATGRIDLGLFLAAAGTYTLDIERDDIGMQLYDGTRPVSLPYTFDAAAGTLEGRFSLCFGVVTGLESVPTTPATSRIFDLWGRRTNTANGMPVIIEGKKVIKK